MSSCFHSTWKMSRSCGNERKTDCSTKLSSLLVLRPHKTLSSSNSPFVASGPREGQSLSLRIDNRMCLSHLPPSPNQNPILVLKSSNLRSPLSPLSRTEDEAEEEANNQSDCFSSIQSFLQRQGSTSILLPDNLPVGGRLQKFWTVWKDLELDPWAVSVVRYGYLLVFSVDPPLSRIPLVQSASSNPTKNLILSQQFQLLLDKGAIEVVHNPQSPGFLLPPVCGSQTKRGMEASHRPECPQQVLTHSQIQDGHPQKHLEVSAVRHMGVQSRSERRLLSNPYPQVLSSVPSNGISRNRLSVQSPSIRHKHCPLGFHQSGVCCQVNVPPGQDVLISVPGRLAGRCPRPEVSQTPFRSSCSNLLQAGVSHQLGEIRPESHSKLRVRGNAFRPSSRESLHYSQKSPESPTDGSRVCSTRECNSSSMAVSHRDCGRPSHSSSLRPTKSQASPVLSQRQVESSKRSSESVDSCSKAHQGSPSLVVSSHQSQSRCSSQRSSFHSQDLHRCISERLGSPLGEFSNPRALVPDGVKPPHQHSRNESGSFSPPEFLLSCGLLNLGSHGQYHGGRIYQPPRGDKVKVPLARMPISLSPDRVKSVVPQGETYSRFAQCPCGRTLQERSNPPFRMDASSRHCSERFCHLGHSQCRPLCHQVQLSMSNLCVSCSRPICYRCRCSFHKLGGHERLRLSPSPDHDTSSHKSQGDKVSLPDSHSPHVAQAAVVPATPATSGSQSDKAAHLDQNASSAKVRQVSSKPIPPKSARLEVAEKSLRDKGFSEETLGRILAPQASSTLAVYQGKWNVFVSWCSSRNIVPTQVQVPQLADFLTHLFVDKQYSHKTVEGYRTAIAGSIKPIDGRDLGQDPFLSNLLKSFKRERPRSIHEFPSWDLSLVLFSLIKEPFEPLAEAPLKLVTFKTVFLTLLASGCRRGELHAISYEKFTHSQGWKSVVLHPLVSFISKTQLRAKGASALEPITIPSLASYLGSDLSEDRLLCPVRALKIYLSRTQGMRSGKTRLFISFLPGKSSDISKNTISGWIRSLLHLVYTNANKDAASLCGRTTHAIRSMASSLAFSGQVDIEEVLKACSWKSHTTFSEFYLKDMSQVKGNLLTLGPLVAAQRVVTC